MRSGPATRLLTGWGRATWSSARVVVVDDEKELERLLQSDGAAAAPFCARGLGRAYGDAAQCAGGTVLDCRGLGSALDIDREGATVRAGAGVSIGSLLAHLVPLGYFLPVTPGTRFVTLGGAIASDIHGKNHHVDGSISSHVETLRLVAPTGTFECGPMDYTEELAATCGGMGLTGVVTEVKVRLLPIETSWVLVDTERAPDLDACLSLLAEDPSRYRYSVAWVDGLARGRRLGRSVLTRANHARLGELPPSRGHCPLSYRPPGAVDVPLVPPRSVLNAFTVSAFNEMWYRKAPKRRETRPQPLSSFFYPLDGVGSWNRLYGPRGFTQYQFVVPFGAEHVLVRALEALSGARMASFLAVLKSFGPAAAGPLSFPAEGWTLALDLPVGQAGLGKLLDELDTVVAEAGGRVYLSKDARLRPELMKTMYPRLAEWQATRGRLDPHGVMSSDLARRLCLVPGRLSRHPRTEGQG